MTVHKTSRFYETEPVDYQDQDWFVNVAVQIETALTPGDLLVALKNIEKKMGRKNTSVRFGPRTLDLDIILYDDLVLQTAALTIPHPRMHERRFVLIPVCDIAPDAVHPINGKTVRQMLAALRDADGQQVNDY